jgi:hypothetical protein
MKARNKTARSWFLLCSLPLIFASAGSLEGDDQIWQSDESRNRAIYAERKAMEPSDSKREEDRRFFYKVLENRVKQNIFNSYQKLMVLQDDDLEGTD